MWISHGSCKDECGTRRGDNCERTDKYIDCENKDKCKDDYTDECGDNSERTDKCKAESEDDCKYID